MMKNIKRMIPMLGLLLTGACVEDVLDRRMDTNYTEEQVFSSYTTIRNFGIGIYNHLPAGFDRFNGGTLASATDDALHSGQDGQVQQLAHGNWGAFSNPDDQWEGLYDGLRKANLFLENSEDFENTILRDTITAQGKQTYQTQVNDLRWLRAEAHFLKAFFYFELTKRYGEVPIIEEVLDLEDVSGHERRPYGECVDHMLSELQQAMEGMRDTWDGYDENRMLGRATTGAAMALRSRVLLYAASPLHNPQNDLAKWQLAAEAAYEVINSGRFGLFDNYGNLFRSSSNTEIILSRRYAASNSLERSMYPVGFTGAVGGTNPSQNLVDAYQTANGLSITEDESYDPQQPYQNRDPRLQMSIVTHGATFKGRPVEIWRGGLDGPGRARATKTGYYQKKYVDENLDLLQDRSSVHAWIYFRYGEVLLNYAEAMNEVYGPDGTSEMTPWSAREALNALRARPGVSMPPVTVDGKEAFRDMVRNERRVELAFEEHRYWDVRRWMLGMEAFNSAVRGVQVEKIADGEFYLEYREVDDRFFAPEMYLYPIQAEEINKSRGGLSQTPGW
ncbi:RagB/SusD family nutrient uptake outer membrane protein [Echinicola soli]|uniref:RagB/SusD family nutrient uptake outer membrane protein n=1 Tax=Echinicola soli TaxID=2591634 RepID=A0A514CMU4_9BACT|nr:RagB/SusD family nutrient uptake outer membrane protein [Echinicola soli]QDH81118.1 RagB/SusD family nutrient uptake outer membrane protein [Echinicola soli]